MLNNESIAGELFDVWDEWSSRSLKKYEGRVATKKKWDTFERRPGGFRVTNFLVPLLKEYSQKAYKLLEPQIEMYVAALRHRWEFPKNKYILNSVVMTDKCCSLKLSDTFCPTHDGVHPDDKCHRYLEFAPKGVLCMKCTDVACTGKSFPVEPIQMTNATTNKIFVTNNNNYGTINNYGNGGGQHFDVPIDDDVVIFDDPVFNRLMVDSLENYDIVIAEAMTYYLKASTCTINDKWYRVVGYVWTEIEMDTLSIEFSKLYMVIKAFIQNKKDMSKETKKDKCRIVKHVADRMSNSRKCKNIMNIVRIELKKSKFDVNMNLIAFKNGVFDLSSMTFRNGLASDMITYALDYDYAPEYVDERGLLDMLNGIFPNEGALECFLMFLATGLHGQNADKLLLVLQTMNSDTIVAITGMIRNALGKYCHYENIATPKANTPDALENARILIIDPPKTITKDTIKQYVNDQFVKTLRNAVVPFHANVLCACTAFPVIDNDISNNVGRINLSTYVPKYGNMHNMDLMLLLFATLHKNVNGECVRLIRSNKYENAEICRRFLKECTRPSRGNVKSSDVYDRYIKWTETNNEPPITKQKLFLEMRRLVTFNKNAYVEKQKTTGFMAIMLV
jgi:hypothetical protein